jgi:hypothetical protein
MSNAFSTWLLLSGAVISQTACVKPPPRVQVFRMGERVQVGPLIYNVFEADWRPQLGEGPLARRPARRFLIVHLSVTNSGAETLSAPALKLLDDAGSVYSESIDGQNVPSWWGLIRKVKPADTLEGNILFDVDPKSYKLKLDDDSDPDRKAMVEMPLRFGLEEPTMPSALGTPPRP